MKVKIGLLTAFLALLVVVPVAAQAEEPPIPNPPPAGIYILDELNWLTEEQESSIDSILHGLDEDEIAEIAVVTLDDCGPDKQTFRKALFDSWGIGHADDNDGLLILVCWYGGDASRRSVEQLYGPGWNGILSPEQTDQIVKESFVPAFRQDNPGKGLVAMVREYNFVFRTSTDSAGSSSPGRFLKGLEDWMQGALLILVGLGLIFFVDRFFPGLLRSREDHYRDSSQDRGGDGGGFGGGSSSGGGGSSTRF